jgi:hypothetical protein
MRVVQEDTDYRIFLTDKDIECLCNRKPTNKGIDIFPRYKPLNSDYRDTQGKNRTLQVVLTRNVLILNDERTHDNIFVDFNEIRPIVVVYPPVLAPLFDGGYAVTRYNGESKIWLHREE